VIVAVPLAFSDGANLRLPLALGLLVDYDAGPDLVGADVAGHDPDVAALVGGAQVAESPALIAGLPLSRARVWVGPPLLASAGDGKYHAAAGKSYATRATA